MIFCSVLERGFTTFDLADIYRPAEDLVGYFRKGTLASTSLSQNCQFFTKWVPRPTTEITRQLVTEAIDQSLKRMHTETLDLLQFHWWEYENKYYYSAMSELMHLKDLGKIQNIGLTNFDTQHMMQLVEQDAPIVSNQVSFSILDTRPLEKMTSYCVEENIKLLCYGSLLGGFLSSYWIGKAEPSEYDGSIGRDLTNISLRKYLPWIKIWGGWNLFQELLRTLQVIAEKHHVSLSNIAVKWVLNQPAVGGVIIGVRFGLYDHFIDNSQLFSFQLDEIDLAQIAAIQNKAKNQGKGLWNTFGDCGGEYRRRVRRP
jgi:aryl-alcohol dehydrogenase-like predicted oxidoreductase